MTAQMRGSCGSNPEDEEQRIETKLDEDPPWKNPESLANAG